MNFGLFRGFPRGILPKMTFKGNYPAEIKKNHLGVFYLGVFFSPDSGFPELPPKLRRGQNGLRMDSEWTLNRDRNPDWYHSDPKLTACRIGILSESVLGSE